MKVWLLGLGLTLLCTVHAFEETYLGHWTCDGMWTDCKKMYKMSEKVGKVNVNVQKTEDGFLIESEMPAHGKSGGCQEIKMEFKKGEDNKYHHKCEWAEKTMEYAEPIDDDHMIVGSSLSKKGKSAQIVALCSRKSESTDEAKEKFKQHVSEKYDVPENAVKFFTHTVCSKKE